MISYNKSTNQIEINDNYKRRLMSSRLMSVLILVMSTLRLYMADWSNLQEMDYIFCIITVVFLYLNYKNFLVRIAIDKIEKSDIKYIKIPKSLATKTIIKLINGKNREVFGYKGVEERKKLKKIASEAKIKVI